MSSIVEKGGARPIAPDVVQWLRLLAREERDRLNAAPSPIPGTDVRDLATTQGLVEPGPSGGWRLTKSGRAFLRRHLSEPTRPRAPRRRLREALAASAPIRNDRESPLAWLRQRRDKNGVPLISDAEYDAGERLRAEFHFAQMTPRTTINWTALGVGRSGVRHAPGLGIELRDETIAAATRVNRALAAVGPELSGILVDVCCHLKGLEGIERANGWPQRSARVVLLAALRSLARHYGFDRSAGGGSTRLRHWGTPDYRPSIDVEPEAGEGEAEPAQSTVDTNDAKERD